MAINKAKIRDVLEEGFYWTMTGLKWVLDHISILLLAATVLLAVLLARQCSRAETLKKEKNRLENNIEAMNDTLKNYKKDGYSYAQMLALQLKVGELADSLKLEKGKTPVTITKYVASIRDTVYIKGEVVHDTVFAAVYFSDFGYIFGSRTDLFGRSWRSLSVTVPYCVDMSDGKVLGTDSIEVTMAQDIWLEGTIYTAKDGKTYMVVRTDYPNTVFNSGRGILVDNGDEYAFQARKRFGLGFGIQAGYGIGFRNGQPVLTPYIGLGASLNWNPRRLQF